MARSTLRSQLDEALERINAVEEQNQELLKGNEQAWSNYALMARRVDELSFIDLNNITGVDEDVVPQARRVQTINRIRRLRAENPMAKQAIKLALRFVLGKGVTYSIDEPNTKRIVDDFWNDTVNQSVWTSHFSMQLGFDELLTDGENFLAMFVAPGESPYARVGVVPMEEVTNILYDPDNGRVPVWYRRAYKNRRWNPKLRDGEGDWEPDPKRPMIVRYYRDFRITDEYLADMEDRSGFKIPKGLRAEGVIKHRMINPVRMRSGLRGLSELFASREWFRVFKEFMEDRGAINAQANSMTMQRKVRGSPVDVRNLSGTIGGVTVTPQSDQPLTPSSFRRPLPGSTIDSTDNIDWKSIRVDTGAAAAARDAEMIRSTAGAGTGTPDHYFGATNAALAGAQAVEVAVVKAFEDFQTFLRNDFRETVAYVLSVARDVPITEVIEDAGEVAWNFPPIMTHDIVKWVTAFAQWEQQIGNKNRVVRETAIRKAAEVLGIHNIEQVWDEIEAEEKRLAEIEDQELEMKHEQQERSLLAPIGGPPGSPNGNGASKNGDKPDGQKATTGPQESGLSPDQMRLTKGRPPREGATGPRTRRQ